MTGDRAVGRHCVIDLHPTDAAELDALYGVEAGAAYFVPAMLDSETFVGIRDDGELIAAAGTHVLDDVYGVAAVGAVYVHPQHRGLGLGAAVTVGTIDRIADRATTIGLNCSQANTPARTIYRAMGFTESLAYDECEITAS